MTGLPSRTRHAILALAVALCAVATAAAAPDSASVRVVGVMRASSFGRDDPSLRPLSNALRELGYVEGRDYKLEQLSARPSRPRRSPQSILSWASEVIE